MNRNFFNQSTFERIGQWPLLAKAVVVLGIIFFILVLGFQLMIRDSMLQLSVLRAQEESLKANYLIKVHKASRIQGYRQQVHLLSRSLIRLLKEFSKQNEVSALLDEISRSAKSLGLRCNLFVPESKIVHDFYTELPVHIAVEGNYRQLMMFLGRIAKIKYLITLHELSIQKPLPGAHSNTPKNDLIMDIKAQVLSFNAQILPYDESG